MIKVLNTSKFLFTSSLEKILLNRKKKIQFNRFSVSKIINDVKKNGDKAILKYEKKFSNNNIIIPNPKKIKKLFLCLIQK